MSILAFKIEKQLSVLYIHTSYANSGKEEGKEEAAIPWVVSLPTANQ